MGNDTLRKQSGLVCWVYGSHFPCYCSISLIHYFWDYSFITYELGTILVIPCWELRCISCSWYLLLRCISCSWYYSIGTPILVHLVFFENLILSLHLFVCHICMPWHAKLLSELSIDEFIPNIFRWLFEWWLRSCSTIGTHMLDLDAINLLGICVRCFICINCGLCVSHQRIRNLVEVLVFYSVKYVIKFSTCL